MPSVVVGFDGKPTSEEAVRFAAHEAQMRSVTLRIVFVTHAHHLRGLSTQLGRGSTVSDVPMEKYAEDVANSAAELARAVAPGVDVEIDVADGDPATILTDMSHTALLLVVGTRRRGDVAALVRSSVSHHVSQNAACPIVIVPPAPG